MREIWRRGGYCRLISMRVNSWNMARTYDGISHASQRTIECFKILMGRLLFESRV